MRNQKPDTCAEVRAYFDGDDPELLEDSQIPASFRAHLASCESCREEWEFRKELRSLMQEDRTTAPPELKERVMTEIRGTRQEKKRRFIPFGTIAAAVLVLAVIGIARFGPTGVMQNMSRAEAHGDADDRDSVRALDELEDPVDTKAEDPECASQPFDWFAFLSECAPDIVCTRIYVFEDTDSCPEQVKEWIAGSEARLFLTPDPAYRALYTVPVKDDDMLELDAFAKEVLRCSVINDAGQDSQNAVLGFLFRK